MILPTGATVAVADSETVRLFHNTGVKPGVHLVEITADPPAPAPSGSAARHHTGSANPDGRRLDEDDFAATAINEAMSSSERRLKSFANSPMILPLKSRWKCLRISPRVLGSETTTRSSMVPSRPPSLFRRRGHQQR